MMAVTGWQKHSLRGFLSAVVNKKMALPITSSKSKDGERVYRVLARHQTRCVESRKGAKSLKPLKRFISFSKMG